MKKDMSVTEALKIIRSEMINDPDYRYTWQSNIAMRFYDEYYRNEKKYKNKTDLHKISNQAAKNFLDMLFPI